jgi:hypothetical protein
VQAGNKILNGDRCGDVIGVYAQPLTPSSETSQHA